MNPALFLVAQQTASGAATSYMKVINAILSELRVFDVSFLLWAPLAFFLVLMLFLLVVGRVPIQYTVGNLTTRWQATSLTAAAFTIVVAVLVGLVAFVNGIYALTSNSAVRENILLMSEGSTDEGFSNLQPSNVDDVDSQEGIARVDDTPLVSRETYMVVTQPLPEELWRRGGPRRRFLQLRGIVDPVIAAHVHKVGLFQGGEWFSTAGVREAEGAAGKQPMIECVLGEGIATVMARERLAGKSGDDENKRLDVGDTFQLNERTWIVTGVMDSRGKTFDSEVWAKQSLVGPMFGKSYYTSVVVQSPNAETAAQVRTFFKQDYPKASLFSQLETEYFEKLSETNLVLLYGIVFVTVFLAFGGMAGIMNTMFAAVTQRIKDIGVLRLLGYSRSHVLASFLLESMLIALIGGAVGCAIGSLVDGWTTSSVVGGQGGGGKFIVFEYMVTPATIVAGMLLTMTMGFLGGLIPSLLAMRLTALETLR